MLDAYFSHLPKLTHADNDDDVSLGMETSEEHRSFPSPSSSSSSSSSQLPHFLVFVEQMHSESSNLR